MPGRLFSVIDIETTGGMAGRDKIIEIAIVLVQDGRIIEQWDTLIHPERSIPFEITRITGITDEMVANAPKFYEVAARIVHMTEGAVFVAHNVRFDYSFIKEEFRQLGYTFTKKQLCTVRLTRAAFPGLRSYSLGNLIRHFGIEVQSRHRALDDTLATVELMHKVLLKENGHEQVERLINEGIRTANLPTGLSVQKLQSLPEAPGVYYFYNSYNQVVYVGKAKNIRQRVFQHFSKTDEKSGKLIRKVVDVSYECTGHELIALLLESYEIKALQPEINKAQRTKDYPYFSYAYYDTKGYLCFGWDKTSTKNQMDKTILNHYAGKENARGHLASVVQQLGLCYCKAGVFERHADCFYHQTGECAGADLDKESPGSYNERAVPALELLKRKFDKNFFLFVNGRSHEEKAVILVFDGHYRGFAYVDTAEQYDIVSLKELIPHKNPNPECNQILKTYMESNVDYSILYIGE